jgi:hypothetical protein
MNGSFKLILISLMLLSACTPVRNVSIERYCDGEFYINEEGLDCLFGDVTIDGRQNVKEGVRGGLMGIDTVTGALAWVRGQTEDVCQDASVTYSHPCGRTTVNIPRASLKAEAPGLVKMDLAGRFKYMVTVDCCPSSGRTIHDLYTTGSRNIVAVQTPATYTCPGTGTFEVTGQARDATALGYVILTIVTSSGSCELMTDVYPQEQ